MEFLKTIDVNLVALGFLLTVELIGIERGTVKTLLQDKKTLFKQTLIYKGATLLYLIVSICLLFTPVWVYIILIYITSTLTLILSSPHLKSARELLNTGLSIESPQVSHSIYFANIYVTLNRILCITYILGGLLITSGIIA